jgi:CubicO group peptidase (beta-lactamase class C family)
MTRRFLVALTIAAALPLATLSAAPDDLLYARFEKYLESLRVQAGIPGMAAAVVGESDIVWERPFGWQDVERSIPTRMDTPFHLDGLGQIVTAAVALNCVEQGSLELDDPISKHDSGSPEPNATLRQILSHTTPTLTGLSYAYRPERYDYLQKAIRDCTGDSYRETIANLLLQNAMMDSVPGRDVVALQAPEEGVPDQQTTVRYAAVLARLTTSYSLLNGRRPTPAAHEATTLTPSAGLVSTVRDLAKLDVALKQYLLLEPEMLALAWSTPSGATTTQPAPHGLGWFVQQYDGEPVVWQFGVSESSSSFVMTLPARKLTMILLANSDGLVKPFVLTPGIVTASPFARVFLGLVAP